MTKQRLMLSAAMAALLAGASLYGGARADTTVGENAKDGQLSTSTAGNITIDAGGQVEIKASEPAIIINSNNSVLNQGSISNENTSTATGVLIDTSAGNIVSQAGLYSIGSIDLSGEGTSKAGLAITGGNTFFGPLTFTEITTTSVVGSSSVTSEAQASSITLQGDTSYAVYLAQGTTVDGNASFGGVVAMVPNKNSSVAGNTLMELDGNLEGNLVFDNTASLTNVGNRAQGVVMLGPITPCTDNASLGYTCQISSTAVVGGTTLGNVGSFVNGGSITVIGTSTPSNKLEITNFESGSAVVIGNSIAGGFLNNGPATANTTTTTASIISNGATQGGVAYPALLIDPSATVTATNATIRGPIVFGVIPASIDAVDGVTNPTAADPGYGFINRGTIRVSPENEDESVTALIINGASPVNSTLIQGGLLNTGTVSAATTTSVDTNSGSTADALTIGDYTTIPRLVVSGEETSSATTTPGTINATISGPGGGAATALGILDLASVPEVDVLQHGSISAQISTSTIAPDSSFATTKTPFSQDAVAIVDASGTLRTINNAGSILAVTTVQYPTSDAVVTNTTHAIDLLAGTTGNTVINNSGVIEGDIYFNSGGNNNTLNVGNTGSGFGDQSGNANAAVTAVQGNAITNTPYVYATVSGLILSSNAGFAPTTDPNLLSFGSGIGNQLHVGSYGYVNSVILASAGGLDVEVDNNGQLYIANTQGTGSANVRDFDINGGVLGLTISQTTSQNIPVVLASREATISSTADIGLQFGSFVYSSDPAKPTAQTITLISAPTLSDAGLANQNLTLSQNIPFLFESPTESATVPIPLALGTSGSNQTLTLTLLPRSTGATNADGTAGLDLSGAALDLFPKSAAALVNDPDLGEAIASSLTVYNGTAGPTTGINIAASQQRAQQVFSQFAPDVSGGSRAVAIMITDQATGPIAARQRLLRSYGNQSGEMTLWGEEYAGMINNKGRFDGEGDLTNYKDHGFGFSLGMDAGSARSGWYGGALTFYSSDVVETLPRQSDTNLEWYMLTGYTDWRGNHVFFDTKVDVAYGNFDGKRDMIIGNQDRIAEGKRAGLLGSAGGTTGLLLNYGALQLTPHISLDGMSMREEGYTEDGGGDGLDLQVAPYYANSLRAFVGLDAKTNFTLWDATLSPEARLGYRYDFVSVPVKLKAGFASTGGLETPGNSFTFIGPDPDTSNILGGFSLSGGTDTWNIGINYDWIRGNNASTTQMGTITLLGRI